MVAWYTPEVVCESKDIFNDVFSWDQSRRVRWTSSLRRNICHATAVKPTAAQLAFRAALLLLAGGGRMADKLVS